MRKLLLISFFAGLLLAQALTLAILALALQWNRAMIAQNYCINVDQPELMCAGSCYIDVVTINFVETQNESTATPTQEDRPATTLFIINPHPLKDCTDLVSHQPSFAYQSSCSQNAVRGLFRPPRPTG